MKYRGIFEYEYPTEHKPPVSIDVHLHGDCVKGKIIEWEYRQLEQEPKTGHCKDCKWWKDNNGTYRRGVKAESQCPINRKEVYEGNGYCFLYEPQKSEDKG